MRETSVTVSDLILVKSQKLRNVYFYLGKLASQAWVVKYICDRPKRVERIHRKCHDVALHILPSESEQL
jgi:hypothetical protein